MVLRNVGEIEDKRELEQGDSGHDDNDELMLINSTPDSDEDVEMYSSSDEE